jgi:hypothetical protein
MDLFSEQFAHSERTALQHDIAHAEILGRHVAEARPIRRRRWLPTRGRQLLGYRRTGSATAPALTVRSAATPS